MTKGNYMNAWDLYKVVSIEIKIDTLVLVQSILPFCKEDMLTSEVYDMFNRYMMCECGHIIKYNQDKLKKFLSKVLDFENHTTKQIKDIIEIALNKSIVIDL